MLELKSNQITQKTEKSPYTLDENLFEDIDLPINDAEDINSEDISPITPEEEMFAEDIRNLVQNIIDNEFVGIEEEFTSENNLENHFRWHCLGKNPNRKSVRTNIFYDFKDINKYRNLEDRVSRKFLNALRDKRSIQINSLYDTEAILRGFRKLFEGDFTLVFSTLCGFRNSSGMVNITFVSFANWCTKNYAKGNTIHCLVNGRNSKTLTLYPIDAGYVENKFNSFISNYSNSAQVFRINH